MYNEVLQSMRKWVNNVLVKNSNIIKVEIVKDTPDSFFANIDSERYIGELSVSKTDFRPYRYVEFYVLDIHKDEMQSPAFLFYDKEDDSVSFIIDNLDRGINFIISNR